MILLRGLNKTDKKRNTWAISVNYSHLIYNIEYKSLLKKYNKRHIECSIINLKQNGLSLFPYVHLLLQEDSI